MKKSFSLFAAILLAVITTNAQTLDVDPSSSPVPEVSQQLNEIDLGKTNISDRVKKAVKSFTRDYKNISNAKWFELKEGFTMVRFSQDEINNRVLYDKKGICRIMYRSYAENKLAAEIRHLVKSNYYDYDITAITEVHIGEKMSYFVTIGNKNSWKTIKVVDAEIEVQEELVAE